MNRAAKRRPGKIPSGAAPISSLAPDNSTVQRPRISVDDLQTVADWPLPGSELTAEDRVSLMTAWGPRVLDLVDSKRLQVRRGDGCWYYRPAGWRSLSPERQTRLVVAMLNGDPTGRAA